MKTKHLQNICSGKMVHLYGDSTVRQWFEYFRTALPGRFLSEIEGNRIIFFTLNLFPLELRYIANELDNVVGGTNTVVIFGIWAHLSSFPVKVYIRRLQSIRRAVVRLLNRSPDTVVIIRTANPKALPLEKSLTNSDWNSLRNDKVLRAIFKGLNVHLVDAWEMVLAHHLPHDLHPQPPIIQNMINVILSYICPIKGG
uniref:NXPE C-terminal domain-containing protein n=1 Tax=Acanthochromis polyacanthus TaxID=80966 RepID=A0A3Q1EW70_9TELE